MCKRACGVAQGLRKLRVYAQGPGCGALGFRAWGHDEKGARTKFYVSRIWGLRFAPGRLKQTQNLKPKSLSAFQWPNMSQNSAIHGLVQCLQCPESQPYIIYASPNTLSHTATVWSKRTLALHDFLLILPLVSTAVSLTWVSWFRATQESDKQKGVWRAKRSCMVESHPMQAGAFLGQASFWA